MQSVEVTTPSNVPPPREDAAAAAARRARTVRLTVVLALVAASFYLGFIAMTVMRSQ